MATIGEAQAQYNQAQQQIAQRRADLEQSQQQAMAYNPRVTATQQELRASTAPLMAQVQRKQQEASQFAAKEKALSEIQKGFEEQESIESDFTTQQNQFNLQVQNYEKATAQAQGQEAALKRVQQIADRSIRDSGADYISSVRVRQARRAFKEAGLPESQGEMYYKSLVGDVRDYREVSKLNEQIKAAQKAESLGESKLSSALSEKIIRENPTRLPNEYKTLTQLDAAKKAAELGQEDLSYTLTSKIIQENPSFFGYNKDDYALAFKHDVIGSNFKAPQMESINLPKPGIPIEFTKTALTTVAVAQRKMPFGEKITTFEKEAFIVGAPYYQKFAEKVARPVNRYLESDVTVRLPKPLGFGTKEYSISKFGNRLEEAYPNTIVGQAAKGYFKVFKPFVFPESKKQALYSASTVAGIGVASVVAPTITAIGFAGGGVYSAYKGFTTPGIAAKTEYFTIAAMSAVPGTKKVTEFFKPVVTKVKRGGSFKILEETTPTVGKPVGDTRSTGKYSFQIKGVRPGTYVYTQSPFNAFRQRFATFLGDTEIAAKFKPKLDVDLSIAKKKVTIESNLPITQTSTGDLIVKGAVKTTTSTPASTAITRSRGRISTDDYLGIRVYEKGMKTPQSEINVPEGVSDEIGSVSKGIVKVASGKATPRTSISETRYTFREGRASGGRRVSISFQPGKFPIITDKGLQEVVYPKTFKSLKAFYPKPTTMYVQSQRLPFFRTQDEMSKFIRLPKTGRIVAIPSDAKITFAAEEIPVNFRGRLFNVRRYRQASTAIESSVSRGRGKVNVRVDNTKAGELLVFRPNRPVVDEFASFRGRGTKVSVPKLGEDSIAKQLQNKKLDEKLSMLPSPKQLIQSGDIPVPKVQKVIPVAPKGETVSFVPAQSAYAGKGEYERTAGGLIPGETGVERGKTRITPEVVTRGVLRIKSKQIIKPLEVTKIPESGVTKLSISPDLLTRIRSDSVTRIRERVQSATAQAQRSQVQQVQRIAVPTIIELTPRLPVPRIPEPFKPRIPKSPASDEILKRKKSTQQSKALFVPEIRIKGKFVAVGKPTQSVEEALSKALRTARGLTSATGRARPIGIDAASVKTDFSPNSKLYRPTKNKAPLTFVERQTKRLVTRGEVASIVSARQGRRPVRFIK